MSGHVLRRALYGLTTASVLERLLEILSRHAILRPLDALPDALSTPELNVPCAEGEPQALIAK